LITFGSHHPNKASCAGGAAAGEASCESANRIRCLKRDNAVAEHAKSVHASNVQPGGQPISHSTKSGFKLRRSFDGVGHAEDEDALALMARADFRRREQSSLNRETQLAKVSPTFRASDRHPPPRACRRRFR
jgi:hypothetical protein